MDYLYENLGDEGFQEFCSTLLSKEFPDLQVFPVGQPDGGRDTIAFEMTKRQKDFAVFQIKFIRHPDNLKDSEKWLMDIIQSEKPKINKLKSRGAKKYYLITNARGSAHLDVGTKDRLNKLLEKEIDMPAMCWWRDEINTLFEKDPKFKWGYPQILNGQDILNNSLFDLLQENKEKRKNIVNAYLTDQFDNENKIKFKQIDLESRLFALYTDVPIEPHKVNEKNKELKRTLSLLSPRRTLGIRDEIRQTRTFKTLRAAEFLLHTKVQHSIQRLLIQGGPGQGKSTITQFVCQVHRARLLNKATDMSFLSQSIRDSPVRLPFKVDLRDVASWVEEANPYEEFISNDSFNKTYNKSLEAFLVAHVAFHSKITDFSSNDLVEIFKLSPLLFVFDGFDEIADVKIRSLVVEFINKGINRILANSKSIQVIVTSRPAAAGDAATFAPELYPNFRLSDIDSAVTNEYVEKWITANRLDAKSASELKRLIKEKLQSPHLRDLTKSPMQLAIFISLVRTKGQALPNKRTALYDNYISLFFDRESEKDDNILKNRELIIDLHEYIAWVLHSEAEMLNNNGSVKVGELKQKLKTYLVKEERDPELVDEIFVAMKDRVCALVSRVDGAFEFEVQPIREYFCAKFLYKSAPYSVAGNVRPGTKPDRFRAILRNHYWENVVRFFAGCADAGELDMLIQELRELQDDPDHKYTDYPQQITSQILADYVFTQKPAKLKQVVRLILDAINIGKIINQDTFHNSGEPITLPSECGGKDVAIECFGQLAKLPNNDYATEFIGIIDNNRYDELALWRSHLSKFYGPELTVWLSFGYRLGLIHLIEPTELFRIVNESSDAVERSDRLQYALSGNNNELFAQYPSLVDEAISYILDLDISQNPRRSVGIFLAFASILAATSNWSTMQFRDGHLSSTTPVIDHLQRYYQRREIFSFDEAIKVQPSNPSEQLLMKFILEVRTLLELPVDAFIADYENCNRLVEAGRHIFGDRRIFEVISIVMCTKDSRGVIDVNARQLENDAVPLCSRILYARTQTKDTKYWSDQFKSRSKATLKTAVFVSLAPTGHIIQALGEADSYVLAMTKEEYRELVAFLTHCKSTLPLKGSQETTFIEALDKIKASDRLRFLFRGKINDQRSFLKPLIPGLGNLPIIATEEILQLLIDQFLVETPNEGLLSEIKSLYATSNFTESLSYFEPDEESDDFPHELAKLIMSDSKSYPRIIASRAEGVCRGYANRAAKHVGVIAKKEKWFDDL
jgi:hypothetical protein